MGKKIPFEFEYKKMLCTTEDKEKERDSDSYRTCMYICLCMFLTRINMKRFQIATPPPFETSLKNIIGIEILKKIAHLPRKTTLSMFTNKNNICIQYIKVCLHV